MKPKVFISYSTEDKDLAGYIKTGLELLNFKSFLAHEDIEPGDHWREQIIENMKKCNVFIPLLTEAAKDSVWLHQECGMAVIRDMLIIPIKQSYDPMGCISKYQALKIALKDSKEYETHVNCREIGVFIARKTKTEKALQKHVIGLLKKVRSWAGAHSYVKMIDELCKVSATDAVLIAEATVTNDQVYGSWDAKPLLEKILAPHADKISPSALEKLRKCEFKL